MWKEVILDTFLLVIQLQVVLFSTILLFMVVKSSLAKMLAKGAEYIGDNILRMMV